MRNLARPKGQTGLAWTEIAANYGRLARAVRPHFLEDRRHQLSPHPHLAAADLFDDPPHQGSRQDPWAVASGPEPEGQQTLSVLGRLRKQDELDLWNGLDDRSNPRHFAA